MSKRAGDEPSGDLMRRGNVHARLRDEFDAAANPSPREAATGRAWTACHLGKAGSLLLRQKF
jgi:hypothetical protein